MSITYLGQRLWSHKNTGVIMTDCHKLRFPLETVTTAFTHLKQLDNSGSPNPRPFCNTHFCCYFIFTSRMAKEWLPREREPNTNTALFIHLQTSSNTTLLLSFQSLYFIRHFTNRLVQFQGFVFRRQVTSFKVMVYDN